MSPRRKDHGDRQLDHQEQEAAFTREIAADREVEYTTREAAFQALLEANSEPLSASQALSEDIATTEDPGSDTFTSGAQRRAVREAAGLSLSDLAEAIGLHAHQVQLWEGGADPGLAGPAYRKALAALAAKAAQ